MLKRAIPPALIALAAGVLGYFLRTQQLSTVFDPTTGLAEPGAAVTIQLGILSAAVFVVLAALSSTVPNQKPLTYRQAFGSGPRLIPLLLVFAAGLGLVFGGTNEMMWRWAADEVVRGTVWGVLAILAGISILVGAYFTWGGGKRRGPILLSMVPIVFFCVWLLISYMDRASDPVVLDYMYAFFAMGFSLLSFYYMASFAFGKNPIRRMLVCGNTAVYFCILTLADSQSLGMRAVFASLALTLLIHSFLLVGGAVNAPEPKPDKAEPEAEDPEDPQNWEFDIEQD